MGGSFQTDLSSLLSPPEPERGRCRRPRGGRTSGGWHGSALAARTGPAGPGSAGRVSAGLSAADEVELVAFRVGQGDPAGAVLLNLADPGGAQIGQSADFGLPVGGGQVEV